MLGGCDHLLFPTICGVRLRHASDRTRAALVQTGHDRLVMAAWPTSFRTNNSYPLTVLTPNYSSLLREMGTTVGKVGGKKTRAQPTPQIVDIKGIIRQIPTPRTLQTCSSSL